MLKVEDIRAFIPSKCYATSKQFYQALGFNLTLESDTFCEFENGECSFLLQNFYSEELARNFMMQLVVEDLSSLIEPLSKLVEEFEIKLSSPEKTPYGEVVYLWGPSGELWHIVRFSN